MHRELYNAACCNRFCYILMGLGFLPSPQAGWHTPDVMQLDIKMARVDMCLRCASRAR